MLFLHEHILCNMEIMIKTQADSAFNLFRSRKILTVQEVKAIVGKSLRTTRSRLKQWNAITSYNKNGRYYTLPKIADFNEYGIWSFQGIHFSRHGNLKETFINLVTNTYRALNSTEIGHILQMPPHSFLSHFSNIEGIYRRKLNGRYFWYVTELQYQNTANRSKIVFTSIDDTIGIQILVLCIKHPELDEVGIVELLEQQGIIIGIEQIAVFFGLHGIEKKRAH